MVFGLPTIPESRSGHSGKLGWKTGAMYLLLLDDSQGRCIINS